jgi:hypothetical protein
VEVVVLETAEVVPVVVTVQVTVARVAQVVVEDSPAATAEVAVPVRLATK